MEWYKFSVHTTVEAEEMVAAMLSELGYEGVEISDNLPVTPEESGGLFGDVVPDMPEGDMSAVVSFYAGTDADPDAVIKSLKAGLDEISCFTDIGEGSISVTRTAEEDWINNWKEYFHSFLVDDILIRPTWEEDTEQVPDGVSMVLRIDPGTAFGTGAHESTRLAIRALRKYLRPQDTLLDVGTGSGILGIVALKSGAARVFGTDIDDNTLPAIQDNLINNDIDESRFTRVLGNLIDDEDTRRKAGYGAYNLVTANIIAEILADLTPCIPAHLKKGGLYITSGILAEKEELVLEAADKAGFDLLEIDRMGEWSGMVFRLRDHQ